MSRFYQRPENALKKANEFIEVGKPTRALDTLYDVIKGKKHRAFSEKVIEPIMLKYLELCVELKKPHTAKEGLYQYRLMCQSVNVGLLEKVIRSYIKMAEERTELARDNLKNKVLLEQSTQAVVEVDDLDNVSMADMTLLNVITEEQAQERSDRAALIPWVKFLWESYTQCLDLLRNNARLENLYHDIAQMAFKFCLSYNRKTEFRKLCERLRKHFDDIVNRASSQMNSIDFSSPETQQFNMETRLAQLDSAITMELWQEAYKAIEDIHLLMNQSKKSQTRMMAYYYQKLSLVFWKAGNLLFHAATLLKYYMLCKDMKKNVSQEELQKNASQVVLATLAISFPVSHPEFERFVETDKGMMEKAQKLATLLFLPQPPTRASLIRDLSRYNVLNNAIPKLQGLHDLLETEFNPLGLCSEVHTIVQDIMSGEENEYLQQYIEPLQDVASVRLIKQVSQVYQSIDYNHLLEMTVFTNQARLEQLLVDAVRYNDMQITIDHRTSCIRFGASLAEASREDLPEGPHLQAMPSEAVRLQLVNVFNCLEDAIDMINPSHVSHSEDILRNKIVDYYMLTEKQSHIQILQRQKIIADRREELERNAVDKEYEEKLRSEQIIKQQQIMQAKLLETQREERLKKRMEIEKQELQQRKLEERMKQIVSTQWGMKVALNPQDFEKMDIETIMQKQQEQIAKEAKEHQTRMRSQEKRLDHLERAKRVEEIPVIEKYLKEKKEQEKVEWEAHEAERITHLIEERKLAVANRDRMVRMIKDKDMFLSKLLEARRGEFQAKLADFEVRLAEEKARRLEERKHQRKEDRRRKYIEEKEEEERARLEEIRRVEEEKEREEREKRQREIDEQNRATEEKQRAKNQEIEERLRKGLEERDRDAPVERAAAGEAAPAVWRRGGTGSAGRPTAPSGDSERVPAAAGGNSKPAGEKGAWVPPGVARRRAELAAGGAVEDEDAEPRRSLEITREPRREEDARPDREGREIRADKDRDITRGDRDGGPRGDRDREGPRGDRDRDGPRGDRDGPRADRDGPRGAPRDREAWGGDRGGRDGPRGDRDRQAGPRAGGADRDTESGWRTAGGERSFGGDRQRTERGEGGRGGFGGERRENRNYDRSDRDREGGGGRGGEERRDTRGFGGERSGGESRGLDRENRNFRSEGQSRDFGGERGENRNFRGGERGGERGERDGQTRDFGSQRGERREAPRGDRENRNFGNSDNADNWRK